MDSDVSTQTNFNTISQFNNFDIDTPDEFQDSEPSPSTFSQPPSNPLLPNFPTNPPQPVFLCWRHSQFSPTTSDQPDPPSLITEELKNDLDNFITLQQQLQNNNTLTVHQLSHSISNSESSNQSPNEIERRAHQVFERKHPISKSQLLSDYRLVQLFSLHPLHTNTKNFLY